MSTKSLIFAVLISAVACDGSGNSNGDIALEDLDTELEIAACETLVLCERYPDIASCLESIVISADQERESIKAGRLVYNAINAQQCIDEVTTTNCPAFSKATSRESCEDMFTGTVDIGGDCLSSEECVADAFCDGITVFTCTQGVCVGRSRLGESCSTLPCVSGTHCADDICVPNQVLAEVGEACEGFFDCNDSSFCLDETCIAFPRTGEACGAFFNEASCGDSRNYCGEFADAPTTCKPKLGVGEACPVESEDVCVAYATCENEVCVALSKLGEGCSIRDGDSPCLENLTCDQRVCVNNTREVCPI